MLINKLIINSFGIHKQGPKLSFYFKNSEILILFFCRSNNWAFIQDVFSKQLAFKELVVFFYFYVYDALMKTMIILMSLFFFIFAFCTVYKQLMLVLANWCCFSGFAYSHDIKYLYLYAKQKLQKRSIFWHWDLKVKATSTTSSIKTNWKLNGVCIVCKRLRTYLS